MPKLLLLSVVKLPAGSSTMELAGSVISSFISGYPVIAPPKKPGSDLSARVPAHKKTAAETHFTIIVLPKLK
jgi:hypothetical protein